MASELSEDVSAKTPKDEVMAAANRECETLTLSEFR